MPTDPEPVRRLSLSELAREQLAALQAALSRSALDHSTVELGRNARGDTTIKVSVRTGEGDVETAPQAVELAQQLYDELVDRYPFAGGKDGE